MVRADKILYIGISDTPSWIVSQANTIANLRGWSEFAGIQIEYSLIERTSERELLPMANALEIGVTAWSPLGSRVLGGKYNRTNKAQQQQNTTLSSSNTPITKEGNSRLEGQNELANRFLNDKNILIAQKVTKIAKR